MGISRPEPRPSLPRRGTVGLALRWARRRHTGDPRVTQSRKHLRASSQRRTSALYVSVSEAFNSIGSTFSSGVGINVRN